VVHSVEVLFDADTEATIRGLWDGLAALGLPSQALHTAPSNRPHVTLTVAEQMDPGVDTALEPLLDRLPLPCVIGAPLLFGGRRTVTLVRLVVPSVELLDLHAETLRLCAPFMVNGALPHTDSGHWTPHVTLARRLPLDRLPEAMSVPDLSRDIEARITGLRHWDGNAKEEHWIS
jgi:hypothetical protein